MSDNIRQVNSHDIQPPISLVPEQISLIDGFLWRLGQLQNEQCSRVESPDPSSCALQSDVDDCVMGGVCKARMRLICFFKKEIRQEVEKFMLRGCESTPFKGF